MKAIAAVHLVLCIVAMTLVAAAARWLFTNVLPFEAAVFVAGFSAGAGVTMLVKRYEARLQRTNGAVD